MVISKVHQRKYKRDRSTLSPKCFLRCDDEYTVLVHGIEDFILLSFCGACGCGKTDVGVELELISVRVCFVYPHHVVVLVTCVLLSRNNTVLFMTHLVPSPRHLSHHAHHPPLLSHYTSIHQSSRYHTPLIVEFISRILNLAVFLCFLRNCSKKVQPRTFVAHSLDNEALRFGPSHHRSPYPDLPYHVAVW